MIRRGTLDIQRGTTDADGVEHVALERAARRAGSEGPAACGAVTQVEGSQRSEPGADRGQDRLQQVLVGAVSGRQATAARGGSRGAGPGGRSRPGPAAGVA